MWCTLKGTHWPLTLFLLNYLVASVVVQYALLWFRFPFHQYTVYRPFMWSPTCCSEQNDIFQQVFLPERTLISQMCCYCPIPSKVIDVQFNHLEDHKGLFLHLLRASCYLSPSELELLHRLFHRERLHSLSLLLKS